jgi:hypothetical protein
MCGGGGGGQMVVVVLLVCVVLVSSAAMAGGARTGPAHLAGGTASSSSAPGPAVATPRGDAAGATTMTATTTTMTAAATTATFAADPYKDSKRKVPNGPDPIHNRYSSHLILYIYLSRCHTANLIKDAYVFLVLLF